MKTVELACMLNSAACFMLAVLVFLLDSGFSGERLSETERKVARVRCETPPVRAVRIARREHENEGV